MGHGDGRGRNGRSGRGGRDGRRGWAKGRTTYGRGEGRTGWSIFGFWVGLGGGCRGHPGEILQDRYGIGGQLSAHGAKDRRRHSRLCLVAHHAGRRGNQDQSPNAPGVSRRRLHGRHAPQRPSRQNKRPFFLFECSHQEVVRGGFSEAFPPGQVTVRNGRVGVIQNRAPGCGVRRPAGNAQKGSGSHRIPSSRAVSARMRAADSRSASVWASVTESRRRAVPWGTVGGRTAVAMIPRRRSAFEKSTER